MKKNKLDKNGHLIFCGKEINGLGYLVFLGIWSQFGIYGRIQNSVMLCHKERKTWLNMIRNARQCSDPISFFLNLNVIYYNLTYIWSVIVVQCPTKCLWVNPTILTGANPAVKVFYSVFNVVCLLYFRVASRMGTDRRPCVRGVLCRVSCVMLTHHLTNKTELL